MEEQPGVVESFLATVITVFLAIVVAISLLSPLSKLQARILRRAGLQTDKFYTVLLLTGRVAALLIVLGIFSILLVGKLGHGGIISRFLFAFVVASLFFTAVFSIVSEVIESGERTRSAAATSTPLGHVSEQKKAAGLVCTLCGTRLQPTGSVLDEIRKRGGTVVGSGSEVGWEQWLGTVCESCQIVFCHKCHSPGPSPCPRCGQPLKPAAAMYL